MANVDAIKDTSSDLDDQSESAEFDCVDDSDDDPSFDVVEETRSTLSKLSIKKSKARRGKIVDTDLESEPEVETVGFEIPKFDEKDDKLFEKVEQLIKGGHLDELKVDQCKVYLRKHGLRLTGNKSVLISRIREHLEIIDGCGEKKYSPDSFVLNCKGDACLGDVVIFEQNVYEMFSIASRSATGPSCGTRMVAGRIVKESYGAFKQQHTFTIEVLWSKGVKPWPPLHQLLIKGRNLYRIKTMRQRWADEGERQKVLQEKHNRGSCARYSRELRMQGTEMRKKMMIATREKSTCSQNTTDKENHLRLKTDLQRMKNQHPRRVLQTNNKGQRFDQEMRPNATNFQQTEEKSTCSQNPADKENHLQLKRDAQRMNQHSQSVHVLQTNNKEQRLDQEMIPNATRIQQTDNYGPILPTPSLPPQQNFHYMKDAWKPRNPAYLNNSHVHGLHHKANPHQFHKANPHQFHGHHHRAIPHQCYDGFPQMQQDLLRTFQHTPLHQQYPTYHTQQSFHHKTSHRQ